MTESILQRVARGDQQAVRQCIDEFGGLVWAIARRMTRSRADAEDAVQEIFLELWQKADRFNPAMSAESTFVTMIARRRLIDRYRKLARTLETTP
jgi:RNA polymerase sigma-70 factor (ECF subfamily)